MAFHLPSQRPPYDAVPDALIECSQIGLPVPRVQDAADSTDDGRTVPPLPDLSEDLRYLTESDDRHGEDFSATGGD